MREKEMKRMVLARQPMYLLMHYDYCPSSIASCSPPGVEELLKKFGDYFPKDPPHGLPPLRGIEHQIDLMPRVSIPNRPTYRRNLKEKKESQRQVESLMENEKIKITTWF